MPEIRRRLSPAVSPAVIGVLLFLAVSGSGCRMSRVNSELTPLTDDLAERLQGQVSTVLDRTGYKDFYGAPTMKPGEEPTVSGIGTGAGRTIEQVDAIDAPIPGGGFSRRPLVSENVEDKARSIPSRLALPMVGNVPDMARRLNPFPLPFGRDGDPADEEVADASLNQLFDITRNAVDKLGQGVSPEQKRNHLRKQFHLRVLSIIRDRPEDALSPITGVNDAENEFLQNLLMAQVNYFDVKSIPEPRQRATATIEQLDAAIRNLQPKAQLKLRHLALCRSIQTFGDYEPFEKNEFSPGQGVLLYVEIENFTSQPIGDGRQKTLLKSMITIRSTFDNARIVEQIPVGPTPDICRTTRRDYFHNYEFSFPRDLQLGNYELVLTITDLLGNKVSSETLRFKLR
jgi:hypothetical protein